MELKRLKEDKYLWILIALSFIFIVYWALFSNYRYVTYTSQYYDVGVEAYSLFWHIHGLQYYPNLLDYIVFTNHLSPFSILLLPFFALYPHPTTFFLIEYIFLAMSSILVYFIWQPALIYDTSKCKLHWEKLSLLYSFKKRMINWQWNYLTTATVYLK